MLAIVKTKSKDNPSLAKDVSVVVVGNVVLMISALVVDIAIPRPPTGSTFNLVAMGETYTQLTSIKNIIVGNDAEGTVNKATALKNLALALEVEKLSALNSARANDTENVALTNASEGIRNTAIALANYS